MPEYFEDSEWQAVAKYLYGEEWREKLLQPMVDEEGGGTNNSGSGNGDGAVDGAEDGGDVAADGSGDGGDGVEGE